MGAAICAVIMLSYAGTFRVPFLLDDRSSIVENPSIRSLGNLAVVLAPPPEATTGGRPFLNLTFAINHAISGLDPWSYHLANVLIHVLAALTLFGVVRRTLLMRALQPRWGGLALWFAGVVALIWGLHPVQTQSVTYLSQRAESLMGLFYLLTLYGFIRGLEASPRLWHSLAVGSCLLGALTKEVIVTAPLLVLLYDRSFFSAGFTEALRRRKLFYASLAATWVVIGWLLLDVRQRGVGFDQGISPFHYALTQCDAVLLYLKLCLWPSPLIFDRGSAVVSSVGQVVPQIIALTVMVTASVWAWVRQPRLGFVCACFFGLLAPTSSVVPVAGATVAENRLYLPLAAVVVLVVWALHACLSVRLARALGVMLALTAAAGAFARNRDYSSAIGLWTDVVTKAPDEPRGHYNLSVLLAAIPARQEEALRHYAEALRIRPNYAEAHYNLALLLAAMPGRRDEALGHYAEALRIKPDFADAHYNLALLLEAIPGRRDEALGHYAEAIRIKPGFTDAHNNLALLLAAMPGRQVEALGHYQAALRLKPDYAGAQYNVAVLLAAMPGRQGESLVHFAEAARLMPDHPVVQFNYARQLELAGGPKAEVAAHYQRAVTLDPNFSAAREALERLRK